MTARPTHSPGAFDHRMAVFATDEAFLAAALPFLTEGSGPDEPPPVAIAAPADLDLLRDALGADARAVGLVPHTDWYTGSAANAVARAAGHLAGHAGPGGRAHLLMEPVWNGRAGRSPRESAEWIRYEALANLLFAPTATTVMCAYDTRTAGPVLIEAELPRPGPYAPGRRGAAWAPPTPNCSPPPSRRRPASARSPAPCCGATPPAASANSVWPSRRRPPNCGPDRACGTPARCARTSTCGTRSAGARTYACSTREPTVPQD
jgi:hypothetical protein